MLITAFSASLVPGTGVEPVLVAKLVFETSASTNSATRAKTAANIQFVRNCPNKFSNTYQKIIGL